MGSTSGPLHALCRWYIYAIHGYLLEMVFTATVLDQDWTFQWTQSLLSLLIFGTCGFILERVYLGVRDQCCLFTRCILYTLCIYLLEFSIGYVLRCFGACPWDYSEFRYNFMGLITLEYFLFWFVGSLLLEKLIISNMLRLRLDEAWKAKETPLPKFELARDD